MYSVPQMATNCTGLLPRAPLLPATGYYLAVSQGNADISHTIPTILSPNLGCCFHNSKAFPTHFLPTSVGLGDSVALVCYIVFYPGISSSIFHGFVKHPLHIKKIVLCHICEHNFFLASVF